MRKRSLGVLAVVVFSFAVVHAENWPQWRGPSLNGISNEKNLPVKLNIVEADPSERGIRKVLNFGHTIGHAIESSFLQKKPNDTSWSLYCNGHVGRITDGKRNGFIREWGFYRYRQLDRRFVRTREGFIADL